MRLLKYDFDIGYPWRQAGDHDFANVYTVYTSIYILLLLCLLLLIILLLLLLLLLCTL